MPQPFSRRRFLSNLAILGTTPLWAPREAWSWTQDTRRFTGDDLELAHKLLTRPDDVLAQGAPQRHPELRDTIIVGGGIAGLVAAYRLRESNVLLLESADDIGGVSKSATWRGVEYALGAAYIIDPAPDSEDRRELQGFQLLDELDLRKRDEDIDAPGRLQRRLAGDDNHCVFSQIRVVPEAEIYSSRARRFFEAVLDSDNYPSVPVGDPALLDDLDRISFRAFLTDAARQKKWYEAAAGPISRLGWEAIEYYCWGAFGTTAAETSAYHGLNFFAAEFGDILVYPGGNAFIAKRLAERIRRDRPDAIQTSTWVLRVERQQNEFAVTTWERGTLHEYRGRTVIFSAPLFLAAPIVAGLPEAQRSALASLSYRSYVVANVLLRRGANAIFRTPALRNSYEMTRVHGVDVATRDAASWSAAKVYSDAILADFTTGRQPTHTVLTVYRPYPYEAGRSDLLNAEYSAIEQEVRREVLAGFGPHGLRATDIEGIEICRWGHPMLVTRPGQMADGTIEAAARSQPGLYFAHTDVMGAPAYENALAAAHDAVDAVRGYLKNLSALGPMTV